MTPHDSADPPSRPDNPSEAGGNLQKTSWAATLACALLAALTPLATAAQEQIALSGRVVTEKNEPVAGATVEILPRLSAFEERLRLLEDRRVEPAARIVTRSDGEFSARLAPGPWQVRVRANGYAEMRVDGELLVRSKRFGDLHLALAREVTARVLGRDGSPVAGALVRLRSSTNDRRRPSPTRRLASRSGARLEARTDARGVARFDVAERHERVGLFAVHDGHAQAEVKDATGARIDVTLPAGQPHAARVTDVGGNPVAGAVLAGGNGLPLGQTGDDGQVTVHLAASETLLSARTADGRVGTKLLRQPPAPGATLRVEVAAPPSLEVTVLDQESREPVEGAWVFEGDPTEATRADAQGRAQLTYVEDPRRDEPRLLASAVAPGYFTGSQEIRPGRERGAVILIEPAATVRGRVVDSQGGSVPGVRVSASAAGSRWWRGSDVQALTERDGRFELTPLQREDAFQLEARRRGFATTRMDVASPADGSDPAPVTLRMLEGRTAWGTVVDEGGAPISGVEVELRERPETNDLEAMFARRMNGEQAPSAVSDAEGRFQFEDLATGRYDLSTRGSGFAPANVPAVEIPSSGRVTEIGTITLSPGVELTGRVVDASGQPIEGAEIVAHSPSDGMFFGVGNLGGDDEPDARSDVNGAFVVPDLAEGGTVQVSVKREGYASTSQMGVKVPNLEPLVVQLVPAITLTGVVVDEDGEPVEGANLQTMAEQGTRGAGGFANVESLYRSGRSDDSGAFRIEGLVSGKHRLTVRSQQHRQTELPPLEVTPGEEPEPLRIVLERGARLEGRVTDSAGRPLAEATIQPVQKRQDLASMMTRDFRAARTDANGDFTLEGLGPGPQSFEASHSDYQKQTLDLEIQDAGNRLDFRLDPGLEIRGRVIGPNGTPVAGARISADQPNAGMVIMVGGRGGEGAVTRDDGTFTLKGLSNGGYTVTASKSGFASASTEDLVRLEGQSVQGIELVLGTGAAIVGTVSGVDFDQLSSVQIMAFQAGGTGGGGPKMGAATYEGDYRIEGLSSGNWMVMASLAQGGRSVRHSVTIDPGTQELVLDLDFSGGYTLTGQVLGPNGPMAGVMLFASGKTTGSGSQGMTDQDGRFTFEGLEEDTYVVATIEGTGIGSQKEVEVTGDTDVVLEVRNFRISGRVTDQGGTAVEGAAINLRSLDDRQTIEFGFGASPSSQADGSFQIRSVQPGKYRLQAAKEGYANAVADIELTENDLTGLDLVLERAQGLTLTVRTANGTPVQRIDTALLDGSGQAVSFGSYQAGEAGVFDLSSAPAGSWSLLVQAPGSAALTLPVDVPGERIDAVLPRGGALRVRVPPLMGQATLAKLRVLDAQGNPYRTVAFNRVQTEWQLIDGLGDTGPVPEGVWTLEVRTADESQTWTTTTQVVAETILEIDVQ